MQENVLFVPGRVSLIGGISDLVSPYLSKNKDLIPGYGIAVTIDKGIYSNSKKSNKFIYRAYKNYFECKWNKEELEKEAKRGSFYSYMCGTLYYLLDKYKISGIDIEIVHMDLPMKKGLASSAAICITIVKSVNELYKLNLSKEEIMDIAYKGEHLALSKCGRLDQTSIVNEGVSFITFYENEAKAQKINVKTNINILVVDLNSKKDTRKIMNCFNNALPFARYKNDILVHDVIGINNKNLVTNSIKAIETGDLYLLGTCFTKFQGLMDKVSIICDELKAPVLHSVLEDEYVQKLTYGGKGTGSGGDGSAIFVCKDKDSEELLEEYFKLKYKMHSFGICIKGK